jgi:hypothetical protein
MVASKKGLAKDPAALTAANQLFANCEDMRTRIQTRVAKFIQNPLMDYQKQANSSTAETLLNNVYASGILAGTPGAPGLIGAKTKLDDNVFESGRISDASAYLKDYPGLQWPHGAPAAIALTRVEIPALRPGMVVPTTITMTTTMRTDASAGNEFELVEQTKTQSSFIAIIIFLSYIC